MSEDYNKHSHEYMYEHHTQFVMIRVSKVLKTEAKLNIKKNDRYGFELINLNTNMFHLFL